jgi:dTDP-4-amino-4,6-dideoxygalactose transaminase
LAAIYVTKSTKVSIGRFIWHSAQIIKSGVFTNNGSRVRTLEEKLRTKFGLREVVLMNNGTTPLLFMMAQLPVGSKVLTTPYSFVATSAAIKAMGHIPVFVDVDIETGAVDLDLVKLALQQNRVNAMLFTHVYGFPGPVRELESLSKEHNIPLYFDGAHALGVTVEGTPLLNFGDASSVSFHATKLLSCGEGGALMTTSKDLADKARRWINFGIREGLQVDLGINGKMSELQASLGLSTYPYVIKEIRRRKALWQLYKSRLAHINLVFMQSPNYSYFPVLFPDSNSREKFVDLLGNEKIFPRKYFSPSLDTLEYLEGFDASTTSKSRSIAERVVCLPSGRDVKELTIQKILRAAEVSTNNKRI